MKRDITVWALDEATGTYEGRIEEVEVRDDVHVMRPYLDVETGIGYKFCPDGMDWLFWERRDGVWLERTQVMSNRKVQEMLPKLSRIRG